MRITHQELQDVKEMIDYVQNEFTTTLNKFPMMKNTNEYKRAVNGLNQLNSLESTLDLDKAEYYDVDLITHMKDLIEMDRQTKADKKSLFKKLF